ncbi:uncharacterized protein PG998_003829 [Apiospora kogelbergensis]|uniref:uncharacterized protein n=1 Tax=Apiospora kogelbergensis TaxID=1337665 RepID=UPI00312E8C05
MDIVLRCPPDLRPARILRHPRHMALRLTDSQLRLTMDMDHPVCVLDLDLDLDILVITVLAFHTRMHPPPDFRRRRRRRSPTGFLVNPRVHLLVTRACRSRRRRTGIPCPLTHLLFTIHLTTEAFLDLFRPLAFLYILLVTPNHSMRSRTHITPAGIVRIIGRSVMASTNVMIAEAATTIVIGIDRVSTGAGQITNISMIGITAAAMIDTVQSVGSMIAI